MRRITLVAMLVLGLLGAASAGGAVIAGPGFSADVSATVEPNRLPAQGSAPITLAAEGTLSSTDPSGLPPSLRTVDLSLDRQLGVDTEGLPTCQSRDVLGRALAQARQQCTAALVGSGMVTTHVRYPDRAPFDLHSPVLFFNGAASRLLMYAYVPPPVGPAAIVASGSARGRVLEIPLPAGAGVPVAFQFRLGKTWRYKGQTHSYLSGRCTTGTLRNRITLELDSGKVAATVPQRCTKRG